MEGEYVSHDIRSASFTEETRPTRRISAGAETMTVMVSEDRSMCVQPHQVVRTAWVDIDLCKLGFRLPMSPEAVEKKFRRLLNIGDCAPWPPIVGHWEDGRFLVDDGRHDYLAALMIGREKLFVCWLETVPQAIPDLRAPQSDAAAVPLGSEARALLTG